MSSIEKLTRALADILPQPLPKDDPIQYVRENWPVLHIPLFANVFPLAYCYFIALTNSVSRISALTAEFAQRNFLKIQDWNRDSLTFDESFRNHVFIADERQKEQWQRTRRFWAAKIFSYEHGYLLVKPRQNNYAKLSWDKFVAYLAEHSAATIVTDIRPEAEALKTVLQRAVTAQASHRLIDLDVSIRKERDFHEILHHNIFPTTGDAVRVFLFGTPNCTILQEQLDDGKFGEVELPPGGAVKSVASYICWRSSDHRAALSYSRTFRKFFEDLMALTRDAMTKDEHGKRIAKSFYRVASPRGELTEINSGTDQAFATIFWTCIKHMKPPEGNAFSNVESVGPAR